MDLATPEEIVVALGLQPHPLEGGYFRETYQSRQRIPGEDRPFATAIYYLLTPKTFSRMHRLPTDEIFHFYLGDPVEQLQLRPNGDAEIVTLGPNLIAGQRPQVIVPGGVWTGARLARGGRCALLGTTMAPGFLFADFESGNRGELCRDYPQFQEMIEELTRVVE